MKNKSKLWEVASLFFKLGCFAFGGPAAHVAMMEEEVIEKRKWMSRQHFLDLMGATNLIPGPNSTEMTMHCGHERAGALGLFVAGICFIFPAFVITLLLAWLYTSYGQLPQVEPFLVGIKPAVLAIIAGAIVKLGKKALKNWEIGILGAITLVACLFGVNEILAMMSTGFLGILYFGIRNNSFSDAKKMLPFVFLQGTTTASAAAVSSVKVFWTFLKVGAILYGSGYVLFAYLDAELVNQGWLTRQELIDAIAIGQLTPGPVLSTATFIGYQLAGFSGAILATIGIFLPSFLFVWILNPLIPKMRQSKLLSHFLDSINIAAVAVMIAVLFSMAQETLISWQSIVIAILALAATFLTKKISSIWIVIVGSLLGYCLHLFF